MPEICLVCRKRPILFKSAGKNRKINAYFSNPLLTYQSYFYLFLQYIVYPKTHFGINFALYLSLYFNKITVYSLGVFYLWMTSNGIFLSGIFILFFTCYTGDYTSIPGTDTRNYLYYVRSIVHLPYSKIQSNLSNLYIVGANFICNLYCKS